MARVRTTRAKAWDLNATKDLDLGVTTESYSTAGGEGKSLHSINQYSHLRGSMSHRFWDVAKGTRSPNICLITCRIST